MSRLLSYLRSLPKFSDDVVGSSALSRDEADALAKALDGDLRTILICQFEDQLDNQGIPDTGATQSPSKPKTRRKTKTVKEPSSKGSLFGTKHSTAGNSLRALRDREGF